MHNYTFQIAAKELELAEKLLMKASMRKSSNATQEKDGVTGCQRMEKSSLRNMDKEYGIWTGWWWPFQGVFRPRILLPMTDLYNSDFLLLWMYSFNFSEENSEDSSESMARTSGQDQWDCPSDAGYGWRHPTNHYFHYGIKSHRYIASNHRIEVTCDNTCGHMEWRKAPRGDKEYFMYSFQKMTFDDAKRFCERNWLVEGSVLAMPRTTDDVFDIKDMYDCK